MSRKRLVIYTAIIGAYDKIHQPQIVDDSFDFVLFSNDVAADRLGVWQVRRIPYIKADNTRLSRWVKTHPTTLFPDYEASIWIDANVVIQSDFIYARARDLISQNAVISSMWHNDRNCIYDEAAVVAYRGFEEETIVLNWLRKLTLESYPHHFGLFETNVVFRLHHNKIILILDDNWWNCIEHYSRRDQLSFNYCLWKMSLPCTYFISSTENTRNSEHFTCLSHKQVRPLFDSKRDVVHYCRAFPWYNPQQLRGLYEKIVRFRGFLFFRTVVALYYRVIYYVFRLV